MLLQTIHILEFIQFIINSNLLLLKKLMMWSFGSCLSGKWVLVEWLDSIHWKQQDCCWRLQQQPVRQLKMPNEVMLEAEKGFDEVQLESRDEGLVCDNQGWRTPVVKVASKPFAIFPVRPPLIFSLWLFCSVVSKINISKNLFVKKKKSLLYIVTYLEPYLHLSFS